MTSKKLRWGRGRSMHSIFDSLRILNVSLSKLATKTINVCRATAVFNEEDFTNTLIIYILFSLIYIHLHITVVILRRIQDHDDQYNIFLMEYSNYCCLLIRMAANIDLITEETMHQTSEAPGEGWSASFGHQVPWSTVIID